MVGCRVCVRLQRVCIRVLRGVKGVCVGLQRGRECVLGCRGSVLRGRESVLKYRERLLGCVLGCRQSVLGKGVCVELQRECVKGERERVRV